MTHIRTFTDHQTQFTDKKVLIRVDFNVPIKNGKIQDNNRIVQTLPTLTALLKCNASLVIMSHFGRPEPAEVGTRDSAFSLAPVRDELSRLLSKPIAFAEDIIGKEATTKAAALKPGEILLLENVRYYQGETSKDTGERKRFADHLAGLAEIYVNDAFGAAHRSHASTTTVGEILPAYAGLLMEKELHFLGKALESKVGSGTEKFKYAKVAVIGGAKISSKIPLINNLFGKVDKILIGGGMTYTFFKTMGYEIGKSLLEKDLIPICAELLQKSEGVLELPVDLKVGEIDFDVMQTKGELAVVNSTEIPADKEAVDIGPATIDKYVGIIKQAETVIWNGPMGVFECPAAAEGTFAIARGMDEATRLGATTIIGGGDSGAAIKQVGLEDRVSHLSTGGGASLEFLEGKVLPGVAVLMK